MILSILLLIKIIEIFQCKKHCSTIILNIVFYNETVVYFASQLQDQVPRPVFIPGRSSSLNGSAIKITIFGQIFLIAVISSKYFQQTKILQTLERIFRWVPRADGYIIIQMFRSFTGLYDLKLLSDVQFTGEINLAILRRLPLRFQ